MSHKYEMFKDVRFKKDGRIGVIVKHNANGTYDLLFNEPYWHQEYGIKEEDIEYKGEAEDDN